MRDAFGPYILEVKRHALLRDGRPVKLPSTAFSVLVQLVQLVQFVTENRRAVRKEELLAANWPPHVTDEVLTSAIRGIRTALADDARTPAMVGTVHGVGYRFAAPLRLLPAEGPPAMSALPPATEPVHTAPRPAPMKTRDAVRLSCAVYGTGSDGRGSGRCRSARRGGPRGAGPGPGLHRLALRRRRPVARRRCPRALRRADHARGRCAPRRARGARSRGPRPAHARRRRGGLTLHAGIHAAPVALSVTDAAGTSEVFVARSEATDGAEAICRRAGPGEVRVSSAVKPLVAGEFDFERCDGHPDGPACWRVTRIRQGWAGVPRRQGRTVAEFVGRQPELALLRDRRDCARRGDGRIVTVCGPAGQDKSRLLDAFPGGLARDGSEGVLVLRGQCLPYARDRPYHPLAALLDQLPGGPGRLPDVAHAALRGQVGGRAALDAEQPDRGRRRRTFEAIRRLLLDAAAPARLVVAIEDVHRIDATSRGWTEESAPWLADHPVPLLLTCRPPLPANFADAPSTALSLPALGNEDSAALVRSMRPDLGAKAGGSSTAPPAIPSSSRRRRWRMTVVRPDRRPPRSSRSCWDGSTCSDSRPGACSRPAPHSGYRPLSGRSPRSARWTARPWRPRSARCGSRGACRSRTAPRNAPCASHMR